MERIKTILTPLRLRTLDRSVARSRNASKRHGPAINDDSSSGGVEDYRPQKWDNLHRETQYPSNHPNGTRHPVRDIDSDDDDGSDGSFQQEPVPSDDDEDDNPENQTNEIEGALLQDDNDDEGMIQGDEKGQQDTFTTPRRLGLTGTEDDEEEPKETAICSEEIQTPMSETNIQTVSPPEERSNTSEKPSKAKKEKPKVTKKQQKDHSSYVADNTIANDTAKAVTPKTNRLRQKRASAQEKVNEHYMLVTEKLVSAAETHLKYKNGKLLHTKRELKKALDAAKKAQEDVLILEKRLEQEKLEMTESRKELQFAKRQAKETVKKIRLAEDDRTRKEESYKAKIQETKKSLEASQKRPLAESRGDVSSSRKRRSKRKKVVVESESSDDDEEKEEFSDSDDEEFVLKGSVAFNRCASTSPGWSSGRDKSWTCSLCTFINKAKEAECQACETPRHTS